MKILANVTYSLLGDYNELVGYLSKNINGDTYFNTTLVSDIDIDSIDINDYDIVVNVINDEDDIMDAYFKLYDMALSNGRVNRFISYYKQKDAYTNERVYYAKKDVNAKRLHRYLEYVNTDEVAFDLMIYALLYFDADINVHRGMLRLKNYDVIDLGALRFFASNPVLNKLYRKLLLGKEEESTLIAKATINDEETLLDIEHVHKFLDATYDDFDRFLNYGIYLYREIIYSFSNKNITDLDYLFTKEYFSIGHLTSIASCFNRAHYKDMIHDDSIKFEDMTSIMKMVVFSMAFAENNQFVTEIMEMVFAYGKEYELKAKRDDFFHYNAHDFFIKIGGLDGDLSRFLTYIELVENGALLPKKKNLYRAYMRLTKHYQDVGNIDTAIDYACKALECAPRDIDKVNTCRSLFEMYRIKADKENEVKYITYASKYIDLISSGYHDDYSYVALSIINAGTLFANSDTWKNEVIKRGLDCKYINNESYYFLFVKKMFDFGNGLSDIERIEGLKKITNEMIEHFYLRPITMYLGIYNSLLVLAKIYENNDDANNASECYTNAYKYLSILENIDEDIDEDLSYVQYRLGDIAMDMDSAKSYKQLAKADRRIYQYIQKTGKYVDFYDDLLVVIDERYFSDGRKRAGLMVVRNNLNKLINCCQINSEYFRETVSYCSRMVELLAKYNLKKDEEDFRQLQNSYIGICKEKDIALGE